MKIKLLSLGKIKEKAYKNKIDEYIKWIKKDLKFEHIIFKEKKVRDLDFSLNPYYSSSIFCSLIEDGQKMNSYEFSNFIFQSTYPIVFFISGPNGCPKQIKNNSDHLISLSNMTFPHELAILIFIEQVYRAISIHKKSKYHRG